MEKGNFENSYETTVSDDYSNSRYLFKQDTQNLEEENEQRVEMLTDNNGGENLTDKIATSSKKVTTTETDDCNLDIINDAAVDPKSLPSEKQTNNEVTDVVDYADVVTAIDSEMTRLGWDREQETSCKSFS